MLPSINNFISDAQYYNPLIAYQAKRCGIVGIEDNELIKGLIKNQQVALGENKLLELIHNLYAGQIELKLMQVLLLKDTALNSDDIKEKHILLMEIHSIINDAKHMLEMVGETIG